MQLEKSKTLQNLKTALLREGAAFAEYTLFSEQAKKEGLEKIGNVFNLIANNEKAHAEIWFKYYHGIGNTEENLKSSADLEKYEYSDMYAQFAAEAEKEGFTDIAEKFNEVANIERSHEQQFLDLRNQLKSGEFFDKKKKTAWKCANCGNVYEGVSAPDVCPVCSYPKGYYAEAQKN